MVAPWGLWKGLEWYKIDMRRELVRDARSFPCECHCEECDVSTTGVVYLLVRSAREVKFEHGHVTFGNLLLGLQVLHVLHGRGR